MTELTKDDLKPIIVGRLTIPKHHSGDGWVFPCGRVIKDALQVRAQARKMHYKLFGVEAR